jgi:hypothetical protein
MDPLSIYLASVLPQIGTLLGIAVPTGFIGFWAAYSKWTPLFDQIKTNKRMFVITGIAAAASALFGNMIPPKETIQKISGDAVVVTNDKLDEVQKLRDKLNELEAILKQEHK